MLLFIFVAELIKIIDLPAAVICKRPQRGINKVLLLQLQIKGFFVEIRA